MPDRGKSKNLVCTNGVKKRLFKERRSHPFYRLFLSLIGYHRNVRSPLSRIILIILTYICFLSIYISTSITSSPQGGQVVTGNASIQQGPNSTVINQSSQKAIIHWRSFNIGPQERTHFQQPAGGVALNRINPQQGASQIYGVLTATGQIILVNSAGIYFGPSAYVNVGGIIASTSNISNQNFLAGKYIFNQPSPTAGSVINAGRIIAKDYGLVALLGTGVDNRGFIQARMGTVVLASGNKFTLDFSGNQMVNFTIDEPAAVAAVDQHGNRLRIGVNNTGKILADGGVVFVSAHATQGVLDKAINMEGIIQARSVGLKNGEIILDAGPQGIVNVSGKLIASGKQNNETGGTVKILGSQVALTGKAVVDVSGSAGGGKVLIGGGAHGAGPEPNADYTYIGNGVNIYADALLNGNGGQVIIWSDLLTKFYGNIYARGGSLGGSGGWVETSGKENLLFLGNVNVLAPYGNRGTLLLDPTTIYIIEGAAGTGEQDRNFDHGILAFDVHDTPLNTVSVGQLQSFGDIDIILQAQNFLTIGDAAGNPTALNLPDLMRSSLTLQAGDATTIGGGDIIFNRGSSITTGGGSIFIIAGSEKQKTGNATIGGISTSDGKLSITAQQAVTLNDVIKAGAGSVSITALTRDITIGANVNASDIYMQGVNITQNANTQVNVDSGNITYNAGSGTITTGINTQIYSTGVINLIANNMVLDTRSFTSQIGGIDASTYAKNVILTPGTAGTTIGIAGGAGTLVLSQAELNTIHATNARIGSSSSGLITIGAWTPGSTFVPGSGVLTLYSGNGIIQTGAMTLNTNDNLLIRGAGTFALTNSNNVFSNIAASLSSGSLSVTNALTVPLTITSMSDDLGTVSGITAPSGVTISASGTGGSLTINRNINTTNSPISLAGRNINLAANMSIRSGTGNITMNAATGTITLNANSSLFAGNASGTASTINLTADNMSFAATSQIGGTAANTGSAQTVILQPNIPARTIGIAGGAGNLSLTTTELDRIFAANVRIGNSIGGVMTIGTSGTTWTPASTFASNTLTLDTASSISQTALSSINLGSRNLLIRDSNNVSLTNSNNTISNIAANISGILSIVSAAINPLTITNIRDDLGSVSGIIASNVTLNATNAGIVLNNTITATGTGNSIILAGQTFTNNAGASALNPGAGNFLVWSGNPANDNRGGLVYNFKQYNATYGVSPVLGTGSGFLYTIAPVITPSLTGTVSKVYDTTTQATLNSSNYAVLGAIDNDIVTLNNPVSGIYDTQNVANNINVSVSGIAISSATNGNATVYGYQLGSSTANANIGTITPAMLTVSGIRAYNKIYDATTKAVLSTSSAQLHGILDSDIVNLNANNYTANFLSRNIGKNIGISIQNLSLYGAAAGNYTLIQPTGIYANILPLVIPAGIVFPTDYQTPESTLPRQSKIKIPLIENQTDTAAMTAGSSISIDGYQLTALRNQTIVLKTMMAKQLTIHQPAVAAAIVISKQVKKLKIQATPEEISNQFAIENVSDTGGAFNMNVSELVIMLIIIGIVDLVAAYVLMVTMMRMQLRTEGTGSSFFLTNKKHS